MKPTLFILSFVFIFSLAAPTLAANKLSVITFHYDASGNDNYNRNDEYVTIKNISDKKLKLQNWVATDSDSHKFTFPKVNLKPGQQLTIYTGAGTNITKGSSKKVYWGNGWGLWNNDHDTLTIKNKKDKTVLTYSY